MMKILLLIALLFSGVVTNPMRRAVTTTSRATVPAATRAGMRIPQRGYANVPPREEVERNALAVRPPVFEGEIVKKGSIEADLDQAVRRNDDSKIKQLIAQGANVNAKQDLGRTPLILAAGLGHLRSLEALIAAGADVNASDVSGYTALMIAASKYTGLDMVNALIRAGANVNIASVRDRFENKLGWSPLIFAVRNGSLYVVNALIQAGADVNAEDSYHLTVLDHAIWERDDEKVSALIKAGVNVNAVDGTDQTPLMKAAWQPHQGIVNALIKAGVDVNAVDNVGQTALYASAMHGDLNSVKALIEAGANPNAKTEFGETAFDIAIKRNKSEVANYLRQFQPSLLQRLKNFLGFGSAKKTGLVHYIEKPASPQGRITKD